MSANVVDWISMSCWARSVSGGLIPASSVPEPLELFHGELHAVHGLTLGAVERRQQRLLQPEAIERRRDLPSVPFNIFCRRRRRTRGR